VERLDQGRAALGGAGGGCALTAEHALEAHGRDVVCRVVAEEGLERLETRREHGYRQEAAELPERGVELVRLAASQRTRHHVEKRCQGCHGRRARGSGEPQQAAADELEPRIVQEGGSLGVSGEHGTKQGEESTQQPLAVHRWSHVRTEQVGERVERARDGGEVARRESVLQGAFERAPEPWAAVTKELRRLGVRARCQTKESHPREHDLALIVEAEAPRRLGAACGGEAAKARERRGRLRYGGGAEELEQAEALSAKGGVRARRAGTQQAEQAKERLEEEVVLV
jgi:hypothetical protein